MKDSRSPFLQGTHKPADRSAAEASKNITRSQSMIPQFRLETAPHNYLTARIFYFDRSSGAALPGNA